MEQSHILQKTNLLLSFEIARKISPKDVAGINQKLNKIKNGKNKKTEFEKEMGKLTDSILSKETVPGLLNGKYVNTKQTNKLMQLGIDIGKDIRKLKLTKKDESFLVMSIIRLLELSIKDFEQWSNENNVDNNDDDE